MELIVERMNAEGGTALAKYTAVHLSHLLPLLVMDEWKQFAEHPAKTDVDRVLALFARLRQVTSDMAGIQAELLHAGYDASVPRDIGWEDGVDEEDLLEELERLSELKDEHTRLAAELQETLRAGQEA